MAPVGFELGMDLGVAVALGCGGVEVAGAIFAGEVEGVDGSCGAYEEGFGTEAGVGGGGGRRGEGGDESDFVRGEGLGDVRFEGAETAFAPDGDEGWWVCRYWG